MRVSQGSSYHSARAGARPLHCSTKATRLVQTSVWNGARQTCTQQHARAQNRFLSRCCSTPESASEVKAVAMRAQHVMLCLVDGNQYLSDASKEAVREAAALVRDGGGRMTVFVADMTAAGAPDRDTLSAALKDNVQWHLGDRGVTEYGLHVEDSPDCVSASLSDVADEREADLVVLSSSVVHAKQVDANLLAEFCPCPVLLLP